MASEDRLPERASQRGARSGERVAFNDNIFRQANEALEQSAAKVGAETDRLPFICECADESCTTVIRVETAVYARVRSDSRLFLNVPGHEVTAQGWAKVVERHPDYVIVEKIGRAGEIVEMLDDE
jgi:hypothetical protein